MTPADIRDVRRKRICGYPVPASTYRRAGPCQRRGGRCWAHKGASIKNRRISK
jgi:hypothetical protein